MSPLLIVTSPEFDNKSFPQIPVSSDSKAKSNGSLTARNSESEVNPGHHQRTQSIFGTFSVFYRTIHVRSAHTPLTTFPNAPKRISSHREAQRLYLMRSEILETPDQATKARYAVVSDDHDLRPTPLWSAFYLIIFSRREMWIPFRVFIRMPEPRNARRSRFGTSLTNTRHNPGINPMHRRSFMQCDCFSGFWRVPTSAFIGR
jgi:hypothetical protein